MPSKIFESLNPEKREIRLLRLFAAADALSPFVCSLDIISLDDPPSFTALSYEWGDPTIEASHRATIDGHDVRLTANLATALSYMRLWISTSTAFWIDALCINQSDPDERAQQVSIMRNIYQKAKLVSAWVGEASEDSNLAIKLISQASENSATSAARVHWIQSTMNDLSYTPEWEALFRLCERSYWRRGWIIQELVVPHLIALICGDKMVNCAVLLQIVKDLSGLYLALTVNHPILTVRASSPMTRVLVIWKARQEFHTNTGNLNNLLDRLTTLIDYLTSDPRDKVYCLLGITKPYSGLSLPVDYCISTSDLFKRVALYIILGSRSLNILLHCRKSGTAPWTLPSWVPDWTDFAYERVIVNSVNRWCVGGLPNQAVEALYDNEVLKVRASIVGTIGNLCPTGDNGSVTQSIESLRKWTEIALSEACLPRLSHASKLERLRATFRVYRFLYAALFFTVHDRSTTQALLPFGDFVQLNISGAPIEGFLNFLDSEGEFLLQTAMSSTRTLFKADVHENMPGLYKARTLGLCPRKSRTGDTIAVIYGCRYPLILRQVEGTDRYEIIGDAYVHGLMDGQAVGILPVFDICIC